MDSPTPSFSLRTGRLPSTRLDLRAIWALLFVQLFFGSFAVFGKIALREVSPFVLASIRVAAGAVFLSLLARFAAPNEPPFDAKDRRTIVLLALTGIVGNQLLFITGLARTTATAAALLGVTIPLFTLCLAPFVGLGWPSLRRFAGVPIALLGVLFLLDFRTGSLGGQTVTGNLLVLANCLSYSLFLVNAREILGRRSAIAVIAGCFRYGTIPILVVAAPDLWSFRPDHLTSGAWFSLLVIVLFATIGAYALNAWGLSRTSPSTTAYFVTLQPLVAGTAARLLLGETLGKKTLIAAALILGGLAMGTIPDRRRG